MAILLIEFLFVSVSTEGGQSGHGVAIDNVDVKNGHSSWSFFVVGQSLL